MQKTSKVKKVILSAIALAALSASALLAPSVHVFAQQSAADITGTWQGTLQPPQGNGLRIVIKISKADGGGLKALLYSIDQGAESIPATVTLQGPTVKMTIPNIGGTYEGKLDSDAVNLTGTFTQGAPLPLNLKHVADATAWDISNPPPSNEPRKGAPPTAAIVFGVGSPNITAERSGTSIGIVAGGTVYLFDAGAGVERRMMEAAPKLAALQVQRFGPVFITHLDMDHILGLAVLSFYHQIDRTSNLRGGGGDFTIYGPGPAKGRLGIRNIMDHLEAAFMVKPGPDSWGKGIRMEELNIRPTAIHATEIAPGVIYKDANMTVTAFEVAHKTPIAYGFRVQTSDRVIVISGDTSPVDAVIEACNGCDLLFHEMFGVDFGPEGPKGDAQGHTSAVELGEIARRARPKHLVIYHDVNYRQPAALEAIRKAFSGEVTFARDLDIF